MRLDVAVLSLGWSVNELFMLQRNNINVKVSINNLFTHLPDGGTHSNVEMNSVDTMHRYNAIIRRYKNVVV
jgi:hypothetical protein